jgi:hypothetical protein
MSEYTSDFALVAEGVTDHAVLSAQTSPCSASHMPRK